MGPAHSKSPIIEFNCPLGFRRMQFPVARAAQGNNDRALVG